MKPLLTPSRTAPKAPRWLTTAWFNTDRALDVVDLRGRVVVLHAFQMLCPGCVARGIPQAQRVAELFAGSSLAVIGLHTVFEHHEAMQPHALQAFLHEYRVRFPVGVDAPGPNGDPLPLTMRAYAMRGTPTTVLIDAQGRVRQQVFGVHEDILLGAEIQALLMEAEAIKSDHLADQREGDAGRPEDTAGCDSNGCVVPPS
jgi:peroxiredoxin